LSFGCGRWRGLKQKPTAVASRGFLLKFYSTRANGTANYYSGGQNDNLRIIFQHQVMKFV